MKKDKIKVRRTVKKEFDFGNLNDDYSKGEITTDRDFWKQYLDLRFEFETMHGKLINKITERKRRKAMEDVEKDTRNTIQD